MTYTDFIQTIAGHCNRIINSLISVMGILMNNYIFKTLFFVCLLSFVLGIIICIMNIFKTHDNPENLDYKDD